MGRYNHPVRDQRHTARAMKVSLPHPHPDLLPERTEVRFGGRTPRLHRGPANGRNRRPAGTLAQHRERGWRTTVSRCTRSGRCSVTVNRKRRAETAVLMLDGCIPLRRWCSWKRRTSSSVAVSGERRMKAACAQRADGLVGSIGRYRGSSLELKVAGPSMLGIRPPIVTSYRSPPRQQWANGSRVPPPRERVRSVPLSGHWPASPGRLGEKHDPPFAVIRPVTRLNPHLLVARVETIPIRDFHDVLRPMLARSRKASQTPDV